MKYRFLLAITVVTTVIASFYFLTLGSINITFKEVIELAFSEENNPLKVILFNIRFPRIITSILIGMMLAGSGTITQTVFRNSLADPYIIGISSSATFGAVLAYILNFSESTYGIFGFICSLITSIIIFKISNFTSNTNVSNLLIIGIAISALLGAFTSFTIYFIGEDSFKIIMWTMGYLGYFSWEKIAILLLPLIFSSFYFYIKRFELDLLLCSEEEAFAMGIDTKKLKLKLLVISSLIVGFSVAFTGMIGFVGIIIPHIVRLLVKNSNRKVIPLAMLLGGLFLLISDTIARIIIEPTEVPIGVITAFLGAPFFLFLAFKRRKV